LLLGSLTKQKGRHATECLELEDMLKNAQIARFADERRVDDASALNENV